MLTISSEDRQSCLLDGKKMSKNRCFDVLLFASANINANINNTNSKHF